MKTRHLNDKMREAFFDFLNEKFKNSQLALKPLVDKHNDKMRKAFLDFLSDKLKDSQLTFKRLVDEYKNTCDRYKHSDGEYYVTPCLAKLLWNTELFEWLIRNNMLTASDLKYLLNKIDNRNELNYLLCEYVLIEKILKDFILDKGLVYNFNEIIEKENWRNIHTIFDWIAREHSGHNEILKLLDLNKMLYSFDLDHSQKIELTKVLKNNEVALNKLNQIIDSKLESNYDFESLMNYLKKTEKKNVLSI